MKPHDPIAVMLGLDPGIQVFWIPWSSLPAFGGASGDQGQGMTNMRLYYVRS
jgi:hypothetical protein